MNLRKHVPFLLNNLIWFLLLGVVILFSILTDRFLTTNNILNIFEHAAVLGILVIGQSFTLITGNFDLSVESILAVCALVAAWLVLPAGAPTFGGGVMLPPVAAIIVLLLMGLALGWLNGTLITRFKINNFVVTLSTLIILRGVMLVVTEGKTLTKIPKAITALGHDQVGPIPISVIVLLVAFAIAHIVMRYRPFGRDLYAVGGNKDAALASGIDPDRRVRHAYLVSGVMAALAGWVLVGRLGVVTPRMGEGMAFEVMAAAVIGGISLQGGRGGLIGALGGVLLLSSIESGLKLTQVSAFFIETVRGLVILAAMLIEAQKVRYASPASAKARITPAAGLATGD
jgi:ribose/xylose/arabinose/galactoside ABC-type transport system permease subunit